jgi:hypothetical protein
MKTKRLSSIVLVIVSLSGCVIAPPLHRPVPSGVYLSTPHSVGIGVAPAPGNFWIDGRWLLDGGRRHWQSGDREHRSHDNAGRPSWYERRGRR